ncbi:hypothetical protein [Kibdelosporangium phytohabitans]|uniref:Uncharacterized protein n=1 Tax=Kibdelosporangium phytohabitans TaxID=860235 RepID=A0A0N9I4Y1_9PSEU|nr:hypothetical protein [Kibdelosporangium phytohabitans]ALG09893.1 hypothetical protein AOZ06_26020 [Kibdelosporangium phytohabitans]MBE1468704.1 hypothetical protein [Kibdelosporangium phytohabitans]
MPMFAERESRQAGATAHSGPRPGPGGTTGHLLHLQRTAGNLAVAQLIEDQATAAPAVDRFRFEVKAWIPAQQVVDPEAPLREAAELVMGAGSVKSLESHYHGDGHPGYEGEYRVCTAIEFDWDGRKMSNAQVVKMANFGQTVRFFSIVEGTPFSGDDKVRTGQETRTATAAVRGGLDNDNTVSLGMPSANPVTIAPSPDIDADYMLFMSQDEITGQTEATVRWTTDLMPNHGFRVTKNGVVVAEKVVSDVLTRGIDLDSSTGALAIGLWLNSKTNGGAEAFQP